MGREEAIKDSRFLIIGYYEHMPNGDIIVKNFNRQILGYYRKNRDVTVDFTARSLPVATPSACSSADNQTTETPSSFNKK